MVRFLIDHGANIDKSWASRASPVYLAALYAYPNITKMLLDAGASMATKGPGVASLLSCAATGKSESEAIMRRRAHTVKVVLDAATLMPFWDPRICMMTRPAIVCRRLNPRYTQARWRVIVRKRPLGG
ncbi:hypothetical protein CIHG_05106 [Coccidioides immitis H538.4]|uniref:Uncharacterized protein n=2 Tax=Coccidioides immitis TaxID=5501 RepID=A0A0J8RQ23_COCIT|nr:hypothetical protein CIRG_00221 [Coccidioides immitis RMSCC 2394]KMU87165.1 hypothetical protein CIHG_05106 [Coccidioides immitis H538.4]